MILNRDMVKRHTSQILNQSNTTITALKDNTSAKCHLTQFSNAYFDDGTIGTQITALLNENADINVALNDIVLIDEVRYKVYQIQKEAQVLKKLYLRVIDD